ncbi:MAG: long-chain-fatty-acid--CoA ligase [Deltaproteobacteria bacterium]|nr:long-chain-fatty-acid--CoA ligase [Deltaproteobacteria bacterium]MBW2343388.1 long-chain-fatty-acid--CoA ligase [Deltaproteobacteria bacterium]
MNITLTPDRFLEASTKIWANKTLVVCEGERWTYNEFRERVQRLSNKMEDLGVKRQERVVYLGYNCHRLLECFFGVPRMGGVLLPLNIRLATKDFKYIINDAEPPIVLVHPDFLNMLEPILKEIPSVKHFYLLEPMENAPDWIDGEYEALLESASPEPRRALGDYPFVEDDNNVLFYTSGTTGPPKGVMLTHRNLFLHALSVMAGYRFYETTVQMHMIPLFHVNGWGTPHFLTARGGTHVMLRKFDPVAALELIQKERVTHFFTVPTMLLAILDHPDFSSYDLSSLRDVTSSGAPPPSGMLPKAEKAFGSHCRVHNGFGLTETSPFLAIPELPPDLDAEEIRRRGQDTWGFPVVGLEWKIIDETGKDLPRDGKTIGELVVRGDMVMKGYLNKEEETVKAFEGGWFHTGDLASLGPDNSLYIRDRMKDIIISGGENISSLEIEQVLYSHPDILECAVIGKKDDRWGEIPKGIIHLKPEANVTAQEIIQFTREHLAHFKALKEVEFIDQMPLGGTGKIQKGTLRKNYG